MSTKRPLEGQVLEGNHLRSGVNLRPFSSSRECGDSLDFSHFFLIRSPSRACVARVSKGWVLHGKYLADHLLIRIKRSEISTPFLAKGFI
jgi:hypothetical protein